MTLPDDLDIPEAPTWVPFRDVAKLCGMTYPGAKQARLRGTFPIPAIQLGNKLVCDKEAVRVYFASIRRDSLAAVEKMIAEHS